MAEITLMRDAEIAWQETPSAWKASQRKGDPGLRYKRLMPGDGGGPNMQHTEYHPGHREAPHSHPEDEVLFVLSGTLFFGDDALGFGDAIFVPRNKAYSLRTGDEGCAFVRVGLGAAPRQALP